jgi:hypothetical protein
MQKSAGVIRAPQIPSVKESTNEKPLQNSGQPEAAKKVIKEFISGGGAGVLH